MIREFIYDYLCGWFDKLGSVSCFLKLFYAMGSNGAYMIEVERSIVGRK